MAEKSVSQSNDGLTRCSAGVCCQHVARCTFMVLNIILFVFGAVVASGGVWLIVTGHSLTVLTGHTVMGGAAILVLCGVVVSFVSFLGVVGAACLSWQLLMTYSIILGVLIMLEAAAVIAAIVLQGTIVSHVIQQTEQAIMNYVTLSDGDYPPDNNNYIDLLQSNFSCCGVAGPRDWVDTEYLNTTHSLPASCACLITTTTQGRCDLVTLTPEVSDLAWTQGCNQSMGYFVGNYTTAFIGGGVGVAVMQVMSCLMGVVTCVCIMRQAKHRKSVNIHTSL